MGGSRLVRFTFADFSSVIVDDLHLVSVAIPPNETYPPLIIDPDAVLTLTLTSKFF